MINDREIERAASIAAANMSLVFIFLFGGKLDQRTYTPREREREYTDDSDEEQDQSRPAPRLSYNGGEKNVNKIFL